MENDRLIYILNFIKAEILNDKTFYHKNGICSILLYLRENGFVNFREASFITEYLYANKPSNKNEYAEFMDNEFWVDKLCWWVRIEISPETRLIRIKYLTKLISNIKII